MSSTYTPRLDEAVAFAMREFRGRIRKGTQIPYVSHLLQVMVYVAEAGGDDDQLCAAVLHDWLEDIPGARRELLAERFGARVAELVVGLSDSFEHPKPPWRERKDRYIAALRREPEALRLISAADKLHNAQCVRRDFGEVGEAVWGRFAGGRDGTLWYYQAVTEALGDGWSHPLLDRLAAEVQALQAAADAANEADAPDEADAADEGPTPEVAGPDTMEVTLCQTGMQKHAPKITALLAQNGVRLTTVECFDKCETCEIFLLARVEGTLARFRSGEDLVQAIRTMREDA